MGTRITLILMQESPPWRLRPIRAIFACHAITDGDNEPSMLRAGTDMGALEAGAREVACS
jgi:hypothetical protein